MSNGDNSGSAKRSQGGGRPWWRGFVDSADQVVTPAANNFVRTDLFADLVSAATRIEVRIRRRLERQATWYWHQLYLPSAGDMRRVLAQLAALEARVRDVSERLEDHEAASEARARESAPPKPAKKSQRTG